MESFSACCSEKTYIHVRPECNDCSAANMFVMRELAWRLVDAEAWYQEVQLERLAPVNTPRSLTAMATSYVELSLGVCLWRVDDCL